MEPLCVNFLERGANNHRLNPKNIEKPEGRSAFYLDLAIGKPGRAVLRTIYGLAAITIIPAFGVVYHTAKAIDCRLYEKNKEAAGKHLEAAGGDLGALCLVGLSVGAMAIAKSLFRIAPACGGRYSDQAGLVYGFGLIIGSAGLAFPLVPLAFAFSPDRFKDLRKGFDF